MGLQGVGHDGVTFTSLHFSYNWSPDMPVGGALTLSHAPSIIPNRKRLNAFTSSLQQKAMAYFTIQKEEQNFSPPNHSPANQRVYQCNLWEACILWTSSFLMWLGLLQPLSASLFSLQQQVPHPCSDLPHSSNIQNCNFFGLFLNKLAFASKITGFILLNLTFSKLIYWLAL